MKNKYFFFILTCFIVWLFCQTSAWYDIQIRKSQAHEKELILEERKTELLEEDTFTFHTSSDVTPIILNKRTGETWRFYRNMENNELKDDGWTLLTYSALGEKGLTPDIAIRNLRKRLMELDASKVPGTN